MIDERKFEGEQREQKPNGEEPRTVLETEALHAEAHRAGVEAVARALGQAG